MASKRLGSLLALFVVVSPSSAANLKYERALTTIGQADVIFEGTCVENVDFTGSSTGCRFVVDRLWRGDSSDTLLVLSSWAGHCDMAYRLREPPSPRTHWSHEADFQEGTSYLVLAVQKRECLRAISVCGYLDDSEHCRAVSALLDTLGAKSGPEAFDAELLEHVLAGLSNPEGRWAAIDFLLQVPKWPDKAIPVLSVLADTGDAETRGRAVWALAKAYGEHLDGIRPALERASAETAEVVARDLVEGLWDLPGQQVESLILDLVADPHSQVRLRATALAADKLGKGEGTLRLGVHVVNALTDPDPKMRSTAAVHVTRSVTPEDVLPLAAWLWADPVPEVRRVALQWMLSECPDSALTRRMAGEALADSSDDLRRTYLESIEDAPESTAYQEALRSRARMIKDADPESRRRAAGDLSNLFGGVCGPRPNEEFVRDLLLEALEDPAATVRAAALRSLYETEFVLVGTGAHKRLSRAFWERQLEDSDERVREVAREGLRRAPE